MGIWKYEQQILGYNYRMCDINAALGRSQLKRIDKIVSERNEIREYYLEYLNKELFDVTPIDASCLSSLHLMLLKIKDVNHELYKEFFKVARNYNLGIQLHYEPISNQPYYKDFSKGCEKLEGARLYSRSTISIPIYSGLKKWDVKIICDRLERSLNEAKLCCA